MELAHVSYVFGWQFHLLRIYFQNMVLFELVGCRYFAILARFVFVCLFKDVVVSLLLLTIHVFPSFSVSWRLHLHLIDRFVHILARCRLHHYERLQSSLLWLISHGHVRIVHHGKLIDVVRHLWDRRQRKWQDWWELVRPVVCAQVNLLGLLNRNRKPLGKLEGALRRLWL